MFVFPSVYCLCREFSAPSKSKPLVSPPWTRGRALPRRKSKSWDNQPCLIPLWNTAVFSVPGVHCIGRRDKWLWVCTFVCEHVYVYVYICRERQSEGEHLIALQSDQSSSVLIAYSWFSKWKSSNLFNSKTKIISESGVCVCVSYREEEGRFDYYLFFPLDKGVFLIQGKCILAAWT